MVTAVSRFIEQVGSMIKGIPQHNYNSLGQTFDMYPPAGYYLVLNRIIASRWMHINLCMVTAVSRFIEQVGSMIKGIPQHNYNSLGQTFDMYPPAGYYLVLNRIIASRWMHINLYILASRHASVSASCLNFDGL